MNKVSLVRSFLSKAYSSLVMPLGFVAITLVMTNNLPMLHLSSNDLQEADYSPRSRILGLNENLRFQRFVFARTYFVLDNQCSVKPEIYSVIHNSKILH